MTLTRKLIAAAALSSVLLSGCGAHQHSRARDGTRAGSKQSSAFNAAHSRVIDPHRCPGVDGFTCSTLIVPLDHADHAKGTLRLAVGVENDVSAPRGVLLFLAGGPGQPGVDLIPRIQS